MASLRNLPELKKNVCATFLFSWFMVNVCDFLQSFCIFFFFLSRPFSHLSLNYLQSSQREMVLAKSSQRAVWLSWGRCLLAPIAPMQNPGSCSNTWVYLYMNSYVYLEIGVFRLCSTSPSLYLCILSIVHTADLSVHMRSTSTRFPFARFRLAKKLLPIALSLSLQWIWRTVKEQIPTSDFQYLWQVMYYSLQYFSILNILEPDVPVCLGHRQAVHNIDPLGAAEHCYLTTMGPELTLWKFVACGCLWLGRGSTSWQCVLANHQQRSTSKTFTDHLCLIHLFPPSIFNFVFDFFRLTSFQVLLLDIFGGFIMAVASEARSIRR